MKPTPFFLLLLFVSFAACNFGPNEYEKQRMEQVERSRKRHAEVWASHKDKINSLVKEIKGLLSQLEEVEESEDFVFEVDSLGFDPTMGYYSDSAEVKKEFNALYISTAAIGDTLPKEFYGEDFFQSEYFEVLEDMAEFGIATRTYPDSSDDRYWNTACAWMLASDQLRYVVLVQPQVYEPGSVNVSIDEMNTAAMAARLYVYDLKKKEFVGAQEILAFGPDEIYFTYKEGSVTDEQSSAESKFHTENKSYIRKSSLYVLTDYVGLAQEFQPPPDTTDVE
jgi:hypothetical protein